MALGENEEDSFCLGSYNALPFGKREKRAKARELGINGGGTFLSPKIYGIGTGRRRITTEDTESTEEDEAPAAPIRNEE